MKYLAGPPASTTKYQCISKSSNVFPRKEKLTEGKCKIFGFFILNTFKYLSVRLSLVTRKTGGEGDDPAVSLVLNI